MCTTFTLNSECVLTSAMQYSTTSMAKDLILLQSPLSPIIRRSMSVEPLFEVTLRVRKIPGSV